MLLWCWWLLIGWQCWNFMVLPRSTFSIHCGCVQGTVPYNYTPLLLLLLLISVPNLVIYITIRTSKNSLLFNCAMIRLPEASDHHTLCLPSVVVLRFLTHSTFTLYWTPHVQTATFFLNLETVSLCIVEVLLYPLVGRTGICWRLHWIGR